MTRIAFLSAIALLAVHASASFSPLSQHLEAGPCGSPDIPAHFSTSTDFGAVIGTHTWGYDHTAPGFPGPGGNGQGEVQSDADITTTLTSDQITLHLLSKGDGYGVDFSDAGCRATIHFLVPEFSSISVIGTKEIYSSDEGWFLTDTLGHPVASGPVPAGEYIFMAQSKIDRRAGIDLDPEINVTLTVNTPEPTGLILAAAALPLMLRARSRK